jgi:ATP-dependent phosphofructokinase / diphosphate-dependent phosphofructokinase
MNGKLGILAGGGPAPGINGIISAATARACFAGVEVVGLQEGFRWLMRGDTSHVQTLTLDRINGIHFRGGSILGIHREGGALRRNLPATVGALLSLGIDKVVCIGGDGTLSSASQLRAAAEGKIRVVHVPKTIDNDIPLQDDAPTFGFQTAREVGVGIVHNLIADAETTTRWYFVVTQGRQAGHLALGIGKAAGATITLIPEEFGESQDADRLVDTLCAAVIKQAKLGKFHGVAVLAEGLGRLMPEATEIPSNPFGALRFTEFDLAGVLVRKVGERLLGLKKQLHVKITPKNIGYELRCADPIPFDMEYTRDLGYLAAKYLLEGGDGAMVTIQRGEFRAVPFEHLVAPGGNGSAQVRNVNRNSESYKIALRYMTRLRQDDLTNPEFVQGMAELVGLSAEEFIKEFGDVTKDEPPRIRLIKGSAADPQPHSAR